MKALVHISRAQQEIAAKNIAKAKKDVAQAASLMAILKEILPTVKVIDSIQVAMANLTYVNTTEVPQDLVTITASLDQLNDLLPEGKAKEQAKQAKGALAKDKEKGAAKAKEALEAVEESLDFSEADMSVSHVSRCVKLAQEELDNGDSKEAGEALTAAVDGVIFVDFDVVDPASVAAREIWLATQDWAAKDPKATKTRMEKAKAALHDVVKRGSKGQQDQAQHLLGMIDAIDLVKGGEQAGKALQDLWQGAKTLDTGAPTAKKTDTGTPAAKKADTDAPAVKKADTDAPAVKKADTDAPAVKKADTDAPAVKKADTDAPAPKKS